MFGNAEEIILNNLPEVTADEYKKVKVIFKRGGEIVIKCKNFSITKINGDVYGYEINGICGDYPLYINREEIAAIIYLAEHEPKE